MLNNSFLKNSKTKVTITYKDNDEIKTFEPVLSYMDKEECYLTMSLPIGFEKPRSKTRATLLVRTTDGLFKAEVMIVECSVTLKEVYICTTTPAKWDVTESRRNLRINVDLPVKIVYDDGFEINTKTVNLSVQGFAIPALDELPDQYHNRAAKVTLSINENETVEMTAKLYRKSKADDFNEKPLYVYKLTDKLSMEKEIILNNYIKNIYMQGLSI